MLFTSSAFPLFLTAVLLLYYIVPRSWQWSLLLLASYVFYAFSGPVNLIFIAATTAVTYVAARRIDAIETARKKTVGQGGDALDAAAKKTLREAARRRQKRILILCLLIDLGILAVVKYTNFAYDNLGYLFDPNAAVRKLPFLQLALPMGISFYTFQTVSYLIDVYRNKHRAERNPFRFALFVSFFPQLIQGPISRYQDLAQTLYGPHAFDWQQVAAGLQRILWGTFKKLVIADRILAGTRTLFAAPEKYQGIYVLVGMIFYALQLYADFTGGIDITIGIAQTLGIRVRENFLRPYFSKNIVEYWRRWHISMGTFFRDYVFYPISLSRGFLKLSGTSRRLLGNGVGRRLPVHLATLVTWFATGIWHGADWNFIVWGLLNGVIIVLTGELAPVYSAFHRRFPALAGRPGWKWFQVGRTFLLMSSLRMLDCYRDVPLTFRMFGSLFRSFSLQPLTDGSLLKLGLGRGDYIVLALATVLLIAVSLISRRGSFREQLAARPHFVRNAVWLSLFLIVVVFGVYGFGYEASQFIYNQF